MPRTCADSKYGSWYDRVDEALKELTKRANRTRRSSSEGQAIEATACILAGRSSWWPSHPEGAEPIRDLSPNWKTLPEGETHPHLEQV